MTTTEQKLKIIDFLPKSLVELDRKEGTGILERFLNGPQDVWKIINDKIWSLLDLNDPDLCPDVLLKFRKSTVGFTPELDYITENLSDNDLRKLIRLAMTLWGLRGGRNGMRRSLFTMTGRPIQIYDWFDKRYEMETSGMEFIRRVKTDSNLLQESFTVDAIEGFDGITSGNPKDKIFTSANINFREKRVGGGETLTLFGDDAGVYVILKRINDHQVQVTEKFPQGGSTSVHFQIQGGHSEFITDIHIDASGDLDRELVGNLLALQRAPSEIFDVYFWSMIETFEAFNRWSILSPPADGSSVEIKVDDDGEYYVEMLTPATGSEVTISTIAGPPEETDAFIFESTFEYSIENVGTREFFFGFSTGEITGAPPTFYAFRIGFNQIDPNGSVYVTPSIFKLVSGSFSALFSLTSVDDILQIMPQIQPNVKNLIRIIVETRDSDGAIKICAYINGQSVAEVIDETSPIQIHPGFIIFCGPGGNDTTLKIYDFKFTPIQPMEKIRIGLNE